MGEFTGSPPNDDPASFREITVNPVQAPFRKVLIRTTAGNETARSGEVEVH
jgi:hypothetical protein